MPEYKLPEKKMPKIIPAFTATAIDSLAGVRRDSEESNVVLLFHTDDERIATQRYIKEHFQIDPLGTTGKAKRMVRFGDQHKDIKTLTFSAHKEVQKALEMVPGITAIHTESELNLAECNQIMQEFFAADPALFRGGKGLGSWA